MAYIQEWSNNVYGRYIYIYICLGMIIYIYTYVCVYVANTPLEQDALRGLFFKQS